MVFISTAQCVVLIVKEPKIKVLQNRPVKFFGWLPSKFFFPTWKVVTGAYSDRFVKNCEPWNTPKEWFLSRKRPKEGERVG